MIENLLENVIKKLGELCAFFEFFVVNFFCGFAALGHKDKFVKFIKVSSGFYNSKFNKMIRREKSMLSIFNGKENFEYTVIPIM